jgi:hypothetical protein
VPPEDPVSREIKEISDALTGVWPSRWRDKDGIETPYVDAGVLGKIIADTVLGEWATLTPEQRMVCTLAGARIMRALARDYEFSTEFDWQRVEDETPEPEGES